jgi:hypothetical protein
LLLVTDYSSIDDDIWFHNLRKKKIDYRDVYKPSKCSVECGKGEAKLLYANKCCWTCKRCEANQYLQVVYKNFSKFALFRFEFGTCRLYFEDFNDIYLTLESFCQTIRMCWPAWFPAGDKAIFLWHSFKISHIMMHNKCRGKVNKIKENRFLLQSIDVFLC